jgi:hypothetical protein
LIVADMLGNGGTGGIEDEEYVWGSRGTGGASGWLKLILSAAAAMIV